MIGEGQGRRPFFSGERRRLFAVLQRGRLWGRAVGGEATINGHRIWMAHCSRHAGSRPWWRWSAALDPRLAG